MIPKGYVLWKCNRCAFEMPVMGENKRNNAKCPSCGGSTEYLRKKDLKELTDAR